MSLISGIPPWVQMYFDRLMQQTGKKIGELFPNFSVMVHGGVNFEPYKAKLFESIGRRVDTIELFPASEGFFAFQDSQESEKKDGAAPAEAEKAKEDSKDSAEAKSGELVVKYAGGTAAFALAPWREGTAQAVPLLALVATVLGGSAVARP